MNFQNLLTVLGAAALQNQPGVTHDVSVARQLEHHYDYSNRARAIAHGWRKMRVEANIAAQFYAISEKPLARRPRNTAPNQMQFHEDVLLNAAILFRGAGADVATGVVNAGELSTEIGSGDCATWLRVMRDQRLGRWGAETKLLFDQAAEAIRVISNEGGHIRRTCDWEPIEIVGFDVRRSDDKAVVTVDVDNHNPFDSPVAPILIQLPNGRRRLGWPKKKSFPALKRFKFKFAVPFFKGEIDVRFAPPRD